MKIISPFHDYYDRYAVQTDADLVYVRERKELKVDNTYPIPCEFSATDKKYNTFRVKFGIVGFCGRIYPFVQVNANSFSAFFGKGETLYSYRELERSYPTLVDGGAVLDRYSNIRLKDLRDFLASYGRPDRADNGLYEFHKCCYYSLMPYRYDENRANFAVHDPLKALEFFRVFDPMQAYQQIEMFVGNRLFKRDNPRIDPVPDKIKAESHGFNKFSFRKDSSKKG